MDEDYKALLQLFFYIIAPLFESHLAQFHEVQQQNIIKIK